MQEQVNKSPDEPLNQQAPRPNRGRFGPGDRRINREGRPKGKTASQDGNPSVDLAPQTDRLMLLILPERYLAFRLQKQCAFWVKNLPNDYEIVSFRVDADQKQIVITIRSSVFPRIARGKPVPLFKPDFDGLMWHNGQRVSRFRS
jgi:hypothetical protein